jgi:GNAT superfamily N-acetyltransferase
MTAGERLAAFGLALPPGHALHDVGERPDLWRPVTNVNASVWPEFMLNFPVANDNWHHLPTDFAEFQLVLLDEAGDVVGGANSAPLPWDGTDDGLPAGWDDQFLRSVRALASHEPAGALGALQITVRPDAQGRGISGLMLAAMRANARAHGLPALIACVRPNHKERYPLTPIERYATWTREDGLPFDPWIRVHVRAGGRIVRPSPASMTLRAPIADWAAWTGLSFPESGQYLPKGAAAPVEVDVEAGGGVYLDPNVWVVHRVE